ncbi:MAG: hypothetical protein OXH72_05605 [Caldilineaceae bacterium]|nr:hypothetical protein [Caldilineaceae bacterium]
MSCDEGYGRSVDFRDGVAALGLDYMVEAPGDTRLWLKRPQTAVPRIRLRLAPEFPAAPLRGRLRYGWTRMLGRAAACGMATAVPSTPTSPSDEWSRPAVACRDPRSGSCYPPAQQDAKCFRQH